MPKSKNSLSLILVEIGFDEWMGISRVNIFSCAHIKVDYSPDLFYNHYWDYSFHEMAVYDLPANLLCKKITPKDKIFYMGHSQG